MANATITTNYIGQGALPYVAPAILAADSVSKKYLQILQNVAYKANLRKFNGVALQAADCQFGTPTSGQMSLTDVVLTVEQFKVNEQICNYELREAWESENMRGANSAAPGEFTSYAAKYVAARVAESIENNIWQGNYNIDSGSTTGATYTDFDGIMAKIVAGTPGLEQNLGGSLTSSNILSKLEGLVTAAGADSDTRALVGNYERTKIYISPATLHLYIVAMAANGAGPYLADGMANKYAGYQVIAPAGFPNDTILMTQDTNLYFGTGLLTDHSKATILNLLETTGEDVTRVILQLTAGTQVVDLGSVAVARRTT